MNNGSANNSNQKSTRSYTKAGAGAGAGATAHNANSSRKHTLSGRVIKDLNRYSPPPPHPTRKAKKPLHKRALNTSVIKGAPTRKGRGVYNMELYKEAKNRMMEARDLNRTGNPNAAAAVRRKARGMFARASSGTRKEISSNVNELASILERLIVT